MSIQFQFLSRKQFPQIYNCFVEAFADYHLDMSYMNQQSILNRAIKNGVDFKSSVGVFDEGKMVGFTLTGLGRRQGRLTAFDAATGIIKDYRGKGIAKQMFQFILSGLKEKNVNTFMLEVLQVNEAGVKAYQKTGFKITREFDCLQLPLKEFNRPTGKINGLSIKTVDRDILTQFESHLHWLPSWENSFDAIKRIPDEVNLYGAFYGSECCGILVYYPGLNWLMTLLVKKGFRRKGIAGALIAHCIDNLPGETGLIKLVNVMHTDTGMIKCLIQYGFNIYVNQYEMEYDLSSC